jgi:hypothetical protein
VNPDGQALRQKLAEALRERDQARVERDDLRRRLDLAVHNTSKSNPVLARWGIWLTNVGTWRMNGHHRSVFVFESDAKREAGPHAEARPLPLGEPTGEPVCPRCERSYGSPHAMGCEMACVDDNGFGEE